MDWRSKVNPKENQTPEDAFEALDSASKAKIIAEDQESRSWWGWCRKCGLKRIGTLAYHRTPCERCGHA